MSDRLLMREWVEMEQDPDGRTVTLRPADHDLPPSRMPRRRLDLRRGGEATALAAGAADAIERQAVGSWQRDGQDLTLDLPGWEGDYRIERLTEEMLVLRHR